MRAVVQRVSRAQVTVEGEVVGRIDEGLCVLVAAMEGDAQKDAAFLAKKIAHLRVFSDGDDRMNLSVIDIQGQILAVSQFTLAGDVRRGNRPSFVSALAPEAASPLFDYFCAALRDHGVVVETGRFRTHMEVELVNDGPVTLLLDSRRDF